jgi:transcriptional regulator with XRE-family HTH domain
MNTFFTRLKEERLRLGLNQTDFAQTGGVQKRAQVSYEQGDRFPDVEYLFSISTIGVDIVYLLTGERKTTTTPTPVSTTTPATSKFETLDVLMTLCSRDELALLHHYRCASAHSQGVIMDTASSSEKASIAAA